MKKVRGKRGILFIAVFMITLLCMNVVTAGFFDTGAEGIREILMKPFAQIKQRMVNAELLKEAETIGQKGVEWTEEAYEGYYTLIMYMEIEEEGDWNDVGYIIKDKNDNVIHSHNVGEAIDGNVLTQIISPEETPDGYTGYEISIPEEFEVGKYIIEFYYNEIYVYETTFLVGEASFTYGSISLIGGSKVEDAEEGYHKIVIDIAMESGIPEHSISYIIKDKDGNIVHSYNTEEEVDGDILTEVVSPVIPDGTFSYEISIPEEFEVGRYIIEFYYNNIYALETTFLVGEDDVTYGSTWLIKTRRAGKTEEDLYKVIIDMGIDPDESWDSVSYIVKDEEENIVHNYPVEDGIDGDIVTQLTYPETPNGTYSYEIGFPEDYEGQTYTIEFYYNGVYAFEITYEPTEEVDVTGVSLNVAEKTLEEGEEFTLVATINPEEATNKNVIWTSSDEEIVEVVDGIITGLQEGESLITVTTQDGGYEATCLVTVTAATIEEEDITSDIYGIEENLIYKIKPGTTIEEFLSNIVITGDVKIYDKDGQEITSNTQKLATGMTIESVAGIYTLVVSGDVNGDGEVDIVDLSRIKLHLIEAQSMTLEGPYLKAADINYDTFSDITDLARLKMLLIGIEID